MNIDQTAPMGPYCLQCRLKFCPENVCFFTSAAYSKTLQTTFDHGSKHYGP